MAAEALTEDNIPKGGIAGFIMPDEDFAVLETYGVLWSFW
jgi:hypothetical protein